MIRKFKDWLLDALPTIFYREPRWIITTFPLDMKPKVKYKDLKVKRYKFYGSYSGAKAKINLPEET